MSNEFRLQLSGFIKDRVPQQASQIVRLISLQVLTGVVLKTPVDTGRARGGWQLEIGVVPQTTTGVEDKSGGATISVAASTLEAYTFGQIVYIVNNVQYVQYLETGSSSQAPSGMVSLTLDEVRAQFA